MEIKDKNFIITKDEFAREILLKNGLIEMPSNAKDLFVFVNEPKKLMFEYDKLKIRFTNKLYF